MKNLNGLDTIGIMPYNETHFLRMVDKSVALSTREKMKHITSNQQR